MTHDLTPHHHTDLAGIDPAFVFDFQAYDEVGDGQRWSTWLAVEPLCRGPEPRPAWVVTSQAAVDTDLGVLKTGKEADAFLLERAVPGSDALGDSVVMVAKRYRGEDHRDFHRSADYTAGRKLRNTRDNRAMARKTAHGRTVAAGQWAWAEWQALVRCHELGLAVPYPVQIDGTELLMEWITVDTDEGVETAPRLAQTRPDPELLASYFDQLREFLAELARHGIGARRPVAVQRPGRGRAPGRHRPAADGRPGRQPGRHGLPDAGLHERVPLVPRPGAGGRRARAVRGAAGARVLESGA